MNTKISKSETSIRGSGSSLNLTSLQDPTDKSHFYIPKKLRYSIRILQILLSIMTVILLLKIRQSSIGSNSYGGAWFISVTSAILAIILMFGNFLRFFNKSWSSKKVLVIESVFDMTLSLSWIILFGIHVTNGCLTTSDDDCYTAHWLMASEFFNSLAWLTTIGISTKDIYQSLFGSDMTFQELQLENRRLGKV